MKRSYRWRQRNGLARHTQSHTRMPSSHHFRGATVLMGPLALISLSSCATFGSAPVYGDIPECERLIPDSMKAPVPGVQIPDSEEAEPWMQAFIGQTGQLDKANERGPAIDHIYKTCLEMHREALKKAKRGFFGRLFS